MGSQIEGNETTMKGTIKFYNSDRGFGFITHDDGAESFFHRSQIMTPGRPDEGDVVQFEIEQREDGRTRARSVKVIA